MKTPQQISESIYLLLTERMSGASLGYFHSDAKLRDDLGLDSSSILQLLVLLEVESGISIPEEAVMKEDFDTVRSITKLLFDAQRKSAPADFLDYEEDIKLHCFVSCLSEVIKRSGSDQRALYFGVWDSEIVTTEDGCLSYHSKTISHDFFVDWFQKLYGVRMHSWYQPQLDKEENVELLVSLVERRTPDQHVMVMLDMHRLPERVNEFNKDPFPHYLMLGTTRNPDEWMVYDPDYRWEGVIRKERILHAMRHPEVGGGFLFSDRGIHEPCPDEIIAYYETCMQLEHNPMTAAIRAIVSAHLSEYDRSGSEVLLGHLKEALDQVPILSIRKYAYEHGLAFFWRELGLAELEFDRWCDVIADLVRTYKMVHFLSIKLATTSDRTIGNRMLVLLDEQDQRERSVKKRLQEVYSIWRESLQSRRPRRVISGVAS